MQSDTPKGHHAESYAIFGMVEIEVRVGPDLERVRFSLTPGEAMALTSRIASSTHQALTQAIS
jgi:hypothetical protein